MKFRYAVTVDCKFERDAERIAGHIAESVKQWGGQLHPDDALFPPHIRRVDVRRSGIHIYTDNKED